MKKKMIQRGLLGFPLGIAIGFVITVIISMCIGDGSFYPVTPELIDTMKNELNAVILQTILCGILGTGFAMASVIWEIDSWSLAKQSGIYFSIACVTMFPIAYITNWMKHNAIGILSYVGIFVAILGYTNTVPQVGDELTTGIFVVTMLLYNGMPILGWVISIVAMKFYPLTGEKMKEIEDHIVKVKEANASEVK